MYAHMHGILHVCIVCVHSCVYHKDSVGKECSVNCFPDAYPDHESVAFIMCVYSVYSCVTSGMQSIWCLYLHVASVPGLPRYAVLLASVNCARAGHTENGEGLG